MDLLNALIAQGVKNNDFYTRELIEIKKRVANTEQARAIKAIQDAQEGMQEVDMFSLGKSVDLEERIKNVEATMSTIKNGGITE